MIPAISSAMHALGSQAAIGPIHNTGLGAPGTANATAATGATGSTSFGSQLSSALSSLDQSQQTATNAAQGLAAGTITDPTQAVTAVENASLAMDLASQIQNKLVTATNTLFATQV